MNAYNVLDTDPYVLSDLCLSNPINPTHAFVNSIIWKVEAKGSVKTMSQRIAWSAYKSLSVNKKSLSVFGLVLASVIDNRLDI